MGKMALGTAFKAFFAVLRGGQTGEAIESVLQGTGVPRLESKVVPESEEPRSSRQATSQETEPVKKASRRSDALTLLSALQREARLVDLVQEPLDQFSDAQVGAAARPCLKQCHQVLDRVFGLAAVIQGEEGAVVEVPSDASPLRVQWTGQRSTGDARGTLLHHGWEATRCELANWTGNDQDALVVAPAQLQG